MNELKLGPATRPARMDLFDSLYGHSVEGLILYERRVDGVIVEHGSTPFDGLLPEGMVEQRVAAIKLDDRGGVYVIAYEIIPDHERRTEALLASARAKLTEEEFDAVRSSRDA